MHTAMSRKQQEYGLASWTLFLHLYAIMNTRTSTHFDAALSHNYSFHKVCIKRLGDSSHPSIILAMCFTPGCAPCQDAPHTRARR